MKKGEQAKLVTKFDLVAVVQVSLHVVNTTKVYGENLILLVVGGVWKQYKCCVIYHLVFNAGVLNKPCHPSCLTIFVFTSEVLGLENVIDEWTSLPRIKEGKAIAAMSMVGGQRVYF